MLPFTVMSLNTERRGNTSCNDGDHLYLSPRGEVCNSSTSYSRIDEVSDCNSASLEAKGTDRVAAP